MMWRWFLAYEDDNDKAILEGYCGLAGKPNDL